MNQVTPLYAVYDVKADAIQQELFPFGNDDVAKRAFSGVFFNHDPRWAIVQQNPGDFYVEKVGDLVLEGSGKLLSAEPVRVCCFDELMPKESKNA